MASTMSVSQYEKLPENPLIKIPTVPAKMSMLPSILFVVMRSNPKSPKKRNVKTTSICIRRAIFPAEVCCPAIKMSEKRIKTMKKIPIPIGKMAFLGKKKDSFLKKTILAKNIPAKKLLAPLKKRGGRIPFELATRSGKSDQKKTSPSIKSSPVLSFLFILKCVYKVECKAVCHASNKIFYHYFFWYFWTYHGIKLVG